MSNPGGCKTWRAKRLRPCGTGTIKFRTTCNGFQGFGAARLFAKPLIWRREGDSNPRYGLSPYNGLANRRLQPLGHPSAGSHTDHYLIADAVAVNLGA